MIIGGPQYRAQDMIMLIMGTPKMVPLQKPHLKIPIEGMQALWPIEHQVDMLLLGYVISVSK